MVNISKYLEADKRRLITYVKTYQLTREQRFRVAWEKHQGACIIALSRKLPQSMNQLSTSIGRLLQEVIFINSDLKLISWDGYLFFTATLLGV
jgi:hypothetical protein